MVGCSTAEAERSSEPIGPTSDSFTVRLTDFEEEKIFRLSIGPVDVPVEEHGDGHHHYGVMPEPKTVTFPKSAYITGFSYRVLDGNGEVLPTDILHHMNVIKPKYRELFLPISQRMLALGKETGSQSLPSLLFGHPVEAGTEVVVSVMLHNPIGQHLEDVSVEVELKYVNDNRPWPLWEVHPFQLDVQFPAGEKAFDLPPGMSTFSYEGSPVMQGRIIAVGSHLHEFAESIWLEDVTAGELLWEGRPIEDAEGNLTGVTIGKLYKKLGKKIFPDHVYRVTVQYNNTTPDTLYQGGMGVVAGVFIPSDADSWPLADTTDPLYQIDRLHYLRKVSGTYEELLPRMNGMDPAVHPADHDADHSHGEHMSHPDDGGVSHPHDEGMSHTHEDEIPHPHDGAPSRPHHTEGHDHHNH